MFSQWSIRFLTTLTVVLAQPTADFGQVYRSAYAFIPNDYSFLTTYLYQPGALALLLVIFYVLFRRRAQRLPTQKQDSPTLIPDQAVQLMESQAQQQPTNEEVKRQSDIIQTLNSLGRKLVATKQVHELLGQTYATVNGWINASSFVIGQLDSEINTFNLWGYRGPDMLINVNEFPTNDILLLTESIHQQQVTFINDIEQEPVPLFVKTLITKINADHLKACICLPLHSPDNQIIGVLLVGSDQKGSYSLLHLMLLQNLATFLAIALHNARIYEVLQEVDERLHEQEWRPGQATTSQPLPVTSARNTEFLAKLYRSIDSHLPDPSFNHEMLAKEIGLSKANLYKKIHSLTGQSVHELIRIIRLKRAYALLQQKTMKVFEVAYAVGFKDQATFSRHFHRYFGKAPKAVMNSQEQTDQNESVV